MNNLNKEMIMKIKSTMLLMIICGVMITMVYAGCGSCEGDAASIKKKASKKAVKSTLVMSLPKDGKVDGLVITSCGKCNLGTAEKGCSLSAKIGDKIYPVKGTSIHDHGDAHGDVGFCSTVRVAWTRGKVIKDVLHVESFSLVGN